jgi:hypothetical protein
MGFQPKPKYVMLKTVGKARREARWSQRLSPDKPASSNFLCSKLSTAVYRTEPMPPTLHEKIRLSMSKWVVEVRLNKEGGFQ